VPFAGFSGVRFRDGVPFRDERDLRGAIRILLSGQGAAIVEDYRAKRQIDHVLVIGIIVVVPLPLMYVSALAKQ